jgi:hypothetical protein
VASPWPATELLRARALSRINQVFLTHQLLDPTEALPLIVDSAGLQRASPLVVHASPETIAGLHAHSAKLQPVELRPDSTAIPHDASGPSHR